MNERDSTFRSYLDEKELESINLSDAQRTKFLDGETMVCEAQKVMLYTPLSDRKQANLGILTVTTFKLSFASASSFETPGPQQICCGQQNALLGPFDVCLSSIDAIYQIGERTSSRKKLVPGQNISGKIKDLLVVCKNMRFLEFGFKLADKDSGRNVANALLHHSFPKRHSLLFAYDYKEPYCNNTLSKEARLFRRRDDWQKEIDRTRCLQWRPSMINDNFQASQTMAATLIVPQSVTDSLLTGAIEHFRNRSCPVWVWGTRTGAALVRMADLLPNVVDRTQENILLEHIRKSHPEKKQPHIIDLTTKECPTPKDVQQSYQKLRDLFVPESAQKFRQQDFKFYGLLDGTKWMQHVSVCLTKAAEAAERLSEGNCTVVLQEGNGQDLNCIVSSLTQLMLDPYFRTKYGFQSLIQKDWVQMGHPFAFRLGHIVSTSTDGNSSSVIKDGGVLTGSGITASSIIGSASAAGVVSSSFPSIGGSNTADQSAMQSPVFLLFLDCVWQLSQQFPSAFQINETYLTTLWDSAHVSIFDTFLFNCEHDRVIAELGSTSGGGVGGGSPPLVLRSVWDWREQFSDKDIALFCNPLYDDSHESRLSPVGTQIWQLDLWTQCYCRWLPDLEIQNGGRNVQLDLANRALVADILDLQKRIYLRGGEDGGAGANVNASAANHEGRRVGHSQQQQQQQQEQSPKNHHKMAASVSNNHHHLGNSLNYETDENLDSLVGKVSSFFPFGRHHNSLGGCELERDGAAGASRGGRQQQQQVSSSKTSNYYSVAGGGATNVLNNVLLTGGDSLDTQSILNLQQSND